MAKRQLTLLLSSAGRRVELMRCFRRDADALGIELRVLASDLAPRWSAACQAADQAFQVPPCSSREFIPTLLEICTEEHVDLLVPTIDPELEPLARNGGELRAKGTELALSSAEVVALARDKLATVAQFGRAGIPVPRTAPLDQVAAAPNDWTWPLLVKPRGGSSSIGVRRLASPAEIPSVGKLAGYVAQTSLRGEEYTVNLFFDHAGGLRCAVPHLRREVRAGEVAKGVTRRHPRLEAIAKDIGKVLRGARGALCFQAMVDDNGQAAVFELNARFGGGYPLTHAAGARFSQWLLEEAAGMPASCHDSWLDGLVMLRYDAAIFTTTGPAAVTNSRAER
jgi:carbamoyl-phosphate synthase large subunit